MQRADSLEKDPDAGKDWRQEEKRMTGLDGWMASRTWHELEQAPGDGKETKQQQIYALVTPTRMLNPMGNIIVQALYSHFVPNYAECNAVTLSFNIQ